MNGTLSLSERKSLDSCEAIIERGVKTFQEVGSALLRIRDSRLYRAQYTTFESYCEKRWGFGRSHAYHLIKAAGAVENVSRWQQQPCRINLSSARELAKLPSEKQADAFTEAIERHGEKPTAKQVREVVEEFTNASAGNVPEPLRNRCSNCGSTDFDDDGDCERCREPAAVQPATPPERSQCDELAEVIQHWIALENVSPIIVAAWLESIAERLRKD